MPDIRQTRPSLSSQELPGKLMLGIAFGQGIALFLLWRALENEAWPSQTPIINFPLWTLAIASPAMMLLCLDRQNLSRSLKAVGAFSVVLALIALHIGWQASPFGAFPVTTLVLAYALTVLIACFKALMYCQQWIAKSPLDYGTLFTYSWRNFLVAAFSALLTLGVSLILSLWGALFSAIGIDFFQELFGKDWFRFPVLASAFGVGALIFRRLVRVIDGVASLLKGLIRLLLPLTASVLVIFLSALPFTGLQPLWETGNGTAVLLWLNAFALFFINAVYQTGEDPPYPPWTHRCLSAAIALLPVVSALALYGLLLRIDEYGWTLLRCWAFTTFALLALFSLGYAWGVIRWRWAWPSHLGRVNTAMGWVVIAVMVLVNSPMLDFRAISLASQWQRVEVGEVQLRDFDFDYASHHLARPGHQRMQALIAEHEATDPELVRIIQASQHDARSDRRDGDDGDDGTFDDLWASLTYRPAHFEPPPGLREAVKASDFGRDSHRFINPTLIRADFDKDGEFEYALLSQRDYDRDWVEFELFFRDGNAWKNQAMYGSKTTLDDIGIAKMLREGEIDVVPPRFNDLKVGELRFHH